MRSSATTTTIFLLLLAAANICFVRADDPATPSWTTLQVDLALFLPDEMQNSTFVLKLQYYNVTQGQLSSGAFPSVLGQNTTTENDTQLFAFGFSVFGVSTNDSSGVSFDAYYATDDGKYRLQLAFSANGTDDEYSIIALDIDAFSMETQPQLDPQFWTATQPSTLNYHSVAIQPKALTPTPTPTAAPTPAKNNSRTKIIIAAVIGVVAGALASGLLTGTAMYCCMKRDDRYQHIN